MPITTPRFVAIDAPRASRLELVLDEAYDEITCTDLAGEKVPAHFARLQAQVCEPTGREHFEAVSQTLMEQWPKLVSRSHKYLRDAMGDQSDTDAAEDIAALSIAQAADFAYRHGERSLEAVFNAIAKRRAIDHARKFSRLVSADAFGAGDAEEAEPLVARLDDASALEGYTKIESDDAYERLVAAIRTPGLLKASQLAAIEALEMHGTIRAAADALEIDYSAMTSRLKTARDTLRRHLSSPVTG